MKFNVGKVMTRAIAIDVITTSRRFFSWMSKSTGE
jgi:hypothetical protein